MRPTALSASPWTRAPLLVRAPAVLLAIVLSAAVLSVAAASGVLFLASVSTGSLHSTAARDCPEAAEPAITNASTASQIPTSQQTPAIDMPGLSEPSFVEALVNPAGVFRDPEEVVHHPWFTHEEKRTILLSWVRDELVIEQVARQALPELRPESRIDAVIQALAQFDPRAAGEYRSAAASIRAHHLGSSFRPKRIP